uniref:TEA domain transcription factor 3 n=1 Tax=Paramormyrops kingsleyae TaxID=1676925 RepID=A0A3B3QSZ9_9TELE
MEIKRPRGASVTIASNEWNANGSPEGALEEGSDEMDKAMDGDAEGVWSPDIEQSFQEALAIYPPCGRRKIILSDEGKMYGRNELIARYIKLRTGKTRTRKQVSSHLQVLARRKSREMQSKLKVCPFSQTPYLQGPVPTPIPSEYGGNISSSLAGLADYQLVSEARTSPIHQPWNKHLFVHIGQTNPSYSDPLLEAVDVRQIYDKFPERKGGLKDLYEKGPQNAFFLVKFWADLSGGDVQDGPGSFYGVSSQYSSSDNMTITVSTKVCSFGKQVVEKVETEFARVEGGRCVYRIHRSPMCEYMINFIHKLKHLPEKYMMNSVLENFTILQVVTNRDTQETLLCIAFVFEVSASEHGAQYHVYRLMKD